MGSDGSYLYIEDDAPRYELDYEVDDILEIMDEDNIQLYDACIT